MGRSAEANAVRSPKATVVGGGAMRAFIAAARRHIFDVSRDLTDDVSAATISDAAARAPRHRVPRPEWPPGDRPSPTSSSSPEIAS